MSISQRMNFYNIIEINLGNIIHWTEKNFPQKLKKNIIPYSSSSRGQGKDDKFPISLKPRASLLGPFSVRGEFGTRDVLYGGGKTRPRATQNSWFATIAIHRHANSRFAHAFAHARHGSPGLAFFRHSFAFFATRKPTGASRKPRPAAVGADRPPANLTQQIKKRKDAQNHSNSARLSVPS